MGRCGRVQAADQRPGDGGAASERGGCRWAARQASQQGRTVDDIILQCCLNSRRKSGQRAVTKAMAAIGLWLNGQETHKGGGGRRSMGQSFDGGYWVAKEGHKSRDSAESHRSERSLPRGGGEDTKQLCCRQCGPRVARYRGKERHSRLWGAGVNSSGDRGWLRCQKSNQSVGTGVCWAVNGVDEGGCERCVAHQPHENLHALRHLLRHPEDCASLRGRDRLLQHTLQHGCGSGAPVDSAPTEADGREKQRRQLR
mmetsp:Transcript_36513/g.92282  ORF Transcript_36513/g.92282 Transcript_36513/m.92282 type:complete len:255 (-) Transcript_36513:1571-2335(-)